MAVVLIDLLRAVFREIPFTQCTRIEIDFQLSWSRDRIALISSETDVLALSLRGEEAAVTLVGAIPVDAEKESRSLTREAFSIYSGYASWTLSTRYERFTELVPCLMLVTRSKSSAHLSPCKNFFTSLTPCSVKAKLLYCSPFESS